MPKIPNYKWESVGDQDKCVRKVCYLGTYLLEHVEAGWSKSENGESHMYMENIVYRWSDENQIPELLVRLKGMTRYEKGESTKILEDWYAMNVLAEQLLTGSDDGEVV